ncbi:MAG: Jag N-terminal domain-containing protein [Actinomycetota bacterium]|nr:Jag N-terminal domain-containing protein [Actinomycetota bacterium]
MDWIEVTARTIEEAKELALDRLGVVEDELEYEVVDEARRGLFGIARGDARIRARVKPISREKPSDRKRRRRPSEHSQRSGQGGGSGRGGSGRGGGSPRGGRAGDRPPTTRPDAGDGSREPNQPREARQSPERAPDEGGGRRRRGGRGRGSGGGARAVDSGERPAHPDDKVKAEVDVDTVPVANQAEHAAKFADELVRTMGFSASVRTEIDEDDVTVHIEGDGLGALVGPRGVTIQALEEVVRAVVQHHAGGHSAWVHVDVAGYRQRRRAALAEFARQVAAEVTANGEERALEPMSAADRKVVHDVISEIDGVDTTSEGEEPRRRVVVLPA